MIDHTTSLTDLFNEAVAMTYNLQANEKFIVKNLFRGFEWGRIPIGNRIKLGSMFFNYVCNHSSIIKPLGKTTQHQQEYIKL